MIIWVQICSLHACVKCGYKTPLEECDRFVERPHWSAQNGNTDAFRFYWPVGCLPLVCFLCENIASSAGRARSREKIEFPLPNSELWQHVTSMIHILPPLFFSCVCDKWATVFLLHFPLPVAKDVLHMRPPPSQALTFFIEGPLFPLVIVFSYFPPQKTLNLFPHQIMTKRHS